jgi:hypothetical protein
MFLGLYSEIARQNVVALRALIAARGYKPTLDDIRRFRQELPSADDGTLLGQLLTSPDFYTTSGCRDLLFHAQEHRLTLPQVQSFLRAHGLRFLGFNLDAQVLHSFRRTHPGERALTDLDLWHAFEREHPRTFAGMYQFWIQKPR